MWVPPTETHDALSYRVMTLAAEQTALSLDEIALDSSFVEDLGYDSLDVVEFVMQIEEEFDLTLPREVENSIATVRQVVDHIRELTESHDDTE